MKPAVVIALNWAIKAFGQNHMYSPRLRCLRVAEEAVELAQAGGVSREQMLKLVEIVYSRPTGEIRQELGGVLMTSYLLCAGVLGSDPEYVFLDELLRVLDKPPEHFANRNQEKLDMGLD